MECPKCAQYMEKISFNGVEIARCIQCNGMWFDMLEHERLKKMQGSEVIDVGDKHIGKEYNDVDRINCPQCHTSMIRMVDKDHHHIWYEACPTCFGVFFDAGEFRDYKKDSFLDSIKDMLTPARN